MKISNAELNLWLSKVPTEFPTPPAKQWICVHIANVDVYVGDKLYIIAVNTNLLNSMEKVEEFAVNSKEYIVDYLQKEDFIGTDYLYIGLQDINLEKFES